MDNKRLKELAGIQINEMVEGTDLRQLTHTIFKLSEKEAYDNAAESGMNVSHDQIFAIAKSIIQTLEDGVSDLIRRDFEK